MFLVRHSGRQTARMVTRRPKFPMSPRLPEEIGVRIYSTFMRQWPGNAGHPGPREYYRTKLPELIKRNGKTPIILFRGRYSSIRCVLATQRRYKNGPSRYNWKGTLTNNSRQSSVVTARTVAKESLTDALIRQSSLE